MELKQYWDIIWRRKWLILTTLLTCLIITAVGTFATAPVYRASVKLRIGTASQGSPTSLRYDLLYADRLMQTYEDIATDAPIRFKLQQAWGDIDKEALSVEILANTELMLIHVEDTDPVRAADIANMAADLLLLEMENSGGQNQPSLGQMEAELGELERELEDTRQTYETLLETVDADSESAITQQQLLMAKRDIYSSFFSTYQQARLAQSTRGDAATVITPAGVPDEPSKPNIPINLILGTFLGLLGGLGLAFVFENLDTKLYTRAQVESVLQLPALGRIPVAEQTNNASKYGAPLEEAYRRLGANVLSHTRQTGHKVYVITSALTGEGKTTVAANLASSLAYSGLNVAVVDCDLHHPALHTIFGIPNERGLTSVLAKQMSLSDAMQIPPMLQVNVLASGPIAANPYDTSQQSTNGVMRRMHPGQVELLSTSQMVATLDKLRERFDVILLDTAPSLEVTDAAVLSPLTDGVILVTDLLQAQQNILHEVRQQLMDVNANLIGCVLTRDNSSLAYYKNLRKQNNRPIGNQPNSPGGPNQPYGSFIATPTVLTQVVGNVKNEVVSERTQAVEVAQNRFELEQTPMSKDAQNGSFLMPDDDDGELLV